jgi:hypothetical protein
VEKEHAIDAVERCSDAVSVVEVPNGDVDAIGKEVCTRRVADEGAVPNSLVTSLSADATPCRSRGSDVVMASVEGVMVRPMPHSVPVFHEHGGCCGCARLRER